MMSTRIRLPRPMARLVQGNPQETAKRLDELAPAQAEGWETVTPVVGPRWQMKASAPPGQQEPDWALYGW